MFYPFLLYALFASVFTISKTGLEYTSPVFFVGSRMLLAGFFLLAYLFIFQRDKFVFQKKDFYKLLRLAVFNIYLTNIFEFWGLQYLTSSKACFIYSLSPFASALFSYWLLQEKMSLKKWMGLGIGFAGLTPILMAQTTIEERGGHFFFFSWPELAVMSAAVCSVYGWILLKQLVTEQSYSPILINGLSMAIGGGIALGHSYTVEPWHPVPVLEYGPFLTCAFLLVIISNCICYNMYGVLLKRFSATFMSFAGLSTPIFTAFFGWLFLGEMVTWPFYVSLAIVFLGLFYFYQEELTKDPLLQKEEIA